MSGACTTPVDAAAACKARISSVISKRSCPPMEYSITRCGMSLLVVAMQSELPSQQLRFYGIGGLSQKRQKAVDHFAGRDAIDMRAHVDGGGDGAVVTSDRHGDRTEAGFGFPIHQGIALLAIGDDGREQH